MRVRKYSNYEKHEGVILKTADHVHNHFGVSNCSEVFHNPSGFTYERGKVSTFFGVQKEVVKVSSHVIHVDGFCIGKSNY